jgi:hypothetical protein
MPICERDPWRVPYFEGVACPENVNVPTDDVDSYAWFPNFRWVYEKLNIAKSQGFACGTTADKPTTFPVFAKPNINLKGMGLESRSVNSEAEFAALPGGHMWMPLLQGDHISTDCAIVNGEVRWVRHALGLPAQHGMFRHWVIKTDQDIELTHFLSSWTRKHMGGYTGMMNFETIGGGIIEAHLRFADQWCDLYGRPWFDALVRLYAEGVWQLKTPAEGVGFSVPLFAKHGHVPPHPTAELQAKIRSLPHISSLQITYYEQRPGVMHPMPPGGFRLGLINCTDLDAGFAARRLLATAFPGCALIIDE